VGQSVDDVEAAGFAGDAAGIDEEDSLDDAAVPDELSGAFVAPSLEEVLSEDGLAAVFFPRLSVLKNPDPLKVTPTGVKTFFTAMSAPVWGWATSQSVSSEKACWTSMVSPVSTNL
jgi:hypothetical protein